MNARDKKFTGKVSEWSLPDGTVVLCQHGTRTVTDSGRYIDEIIQTNNSYKIKSLPSGYEFNEAGEIVKVEAKLYWDGKEPLEVGMICQKRYTSGEWEFLKRRVTEQGSELLLFMNMDTYNTEWFQIGELKPIDTRTDKERFLDDIRPELSKMHPDATIIANYCYDKLAGKDET